MGTTEKVKLRILAFLLKAKESTAKQLEEKADCANKTFLKARQQLEKEGLIQKRYQNRKEGGLKAIYSIPQEKLQAVKVMLEREALKKNYNEKINSLNSPEDIEFYKKKLVNLEKELRYYKGLEILRQYEELPSLPAKAVLEKLKEMGFNGEGKLHNIGIGTGYNHFKPEDIELKIIPEKDSEDLPSMNFDDKFINLKLEYGPLWKVLNFKPVKGFFIIGTYKKPLQICEEIFEEFLLPEIRERFGLSHDEWEIVEPEIRRIFHEELSESEKYEMVRFRNIPKPIESFVREFKELYPISQKPKGHSRSRRIRTNIL